MSKIKFSKQNKVNSFVEQITKIYSKLTPTFSYIQIP